MLHRKGVGVGHGRRRVVCLTEKQMLGEAAALALGVNTAVFVCEGETLTRTPACVHRALADWSPCPKASPLFSRAGWDQDTRAAIVKPRRLSAGGRIGEVVADDGLRHTATVVVLVSSARRDSVDLAESVGSEDDRTLPRLRDRGDSEAPSVPEAIETVSRSCALTALPEHCCGGDKSAHESLHVSMSHTGHFVLRPSEDAEEAVVLDDTLLGAVEATPEPSRQASRDRARASPAREPPFAEGEPSGAGGEGERAPRGLQRRPARPPAGEARVRGWFARLKRVDPGGPHRSDFVRPSDGSGVAVTPHESASILISEPSSKIPRLSGASEMIQLSEDMSQGLETGTEGSEGHRPISAAHHASHAHGRSRLGVPGPDSPGLDAHLSLPGLGSKWQSLTEMELDMQSGANDEVLEL